MVAKIVSKETHLLLYQSLLVEVPRLHTVVRLWQECLACMMMERASRSGNVLRSFRTCSASISLQTLVSSYRFPLFEYLLEVTTVAVL